MGGDPTDLPEPEGADDRILVRRLLDGDQDALRCLIDRYDRLIRYTVFRTGRRHCTRDPEWLEARANEAWTGIVRSLRRVGGDGLPPNLPSYFAQIARNKTLDAARKADSRVVLPFEEDARPAEGPQALSDPEDDPAIMLANLEEIEVLRECIARLNEEDQLLCSEIGLIMEKRWKEAADSLEIAESTLRSRWRKVIGKLRHCIEKKISKKFRA